MHGGFLAAGPYGVFRLLCSGNCGNGGTTKPVLLTALHFTFFTTSNSCMRLVVSPRGSLSSSTICADRVYGGFKRLRTGQSIFQKANGPFLSEILGRGRPGKTRTVLESGKRSGTRWQQIFQLTHR